VLIRASFGVSFSDPDNIQFDPDKGSGVLLDAGSYAMSLIRTAAGEQPNRVYARRSGEFLLSWNSYPIATRTFAPVVSGNYFRLPAISASDALNGIEPIDAIFGLRPK
jgi:predicted dehydrogenase